MSWAGLCHGAGSVGAAGGGRSSARHGREAGGWTSQAPGGHPAASGCARPAAEGPGPWNWLFVPGGPGVGSESLAGLVAAVRPPGTCWLVDLPGDGSNRGHARGAGRTRSRDWPRRPRRGNGRARSRDHGRAFDRRDVPPGDAGARDPGCAGSSSSTAPGMPPGGLASRSTRCPSVAGPGRRRGALRRRPRRPHAARPDPRAARLELHRPGAARGNRPARRACPTTTRPSSGRTPTSTGDYRAAWTPAVATLIVSGRQDRIVDQRLWAGAAGFSGIERHASVDRGRRPLPLDRQSRRHQGGVRGLVRPPAALTGAGPARRAVSPGSVYPNGSSSRLAARSSASARISAVGPVGDDPPAVHDHRARAELQRVEQVVGDHQRGQAERLHDVRELAARGRVQVRRRLVQHQQRRDPSTARSRPRPGGADRTTGGAAAGGRTRSSRPRPARAPPWPSARRPGARDSRGRRRCRPRRSG